MSSSCRSDQDEDSAGRAEWCRLSVEVFPERLVVGTESVVETWELPLQARMAELACGCGGSILEIGFGLGMASRQIQRCGVSSHWIIEAHPALVRIALETDMSDPKPVVVFGFWEDVLTNFGSEVFDGIIFDAYPTDGRFDGSGAATLSQVEPILTHARRLLKVGGALTFLDFSCSVTQGSAFQEAWSKNLSSCRSHAVDVEIPAECQYAAGRVAHVVELIR